eukprot:558898-Hanusia_phi.AAC.3
MLSVAPTIVGCATTTSWSGFARTDTGGGGGRLPGSELACSPATRSANYLVVEGRQEESEGAHVINIPTLNEEVKTQRTCGELRAWQESGKSRTRARAKDAMHAEEVEVVDLRGPARVSGQMLGI